MSGQDDDRLLFSSVYSRFSIEYEALGGKKLSITTGDEPSAFLTIYNYEVIDQKTTNEMKELVAKTWEEFKLLEHNQEIDLKMDPSRIERNLCWIGCFRQVRQS